MIIPANGKVLVEIYKLKHPSLYLPETIEQPVLSVAEVVNGNGSFTTGELVLIPTRAGITILQDGVKYRLINSLDVIAEITDGLA